MDAIIYRTHEKINGWEPESVAPTLELYGWEPESLAPTLKSYGWEPESLAPTHLKNLVQNTLIFQILKKNR